MVQIPPRHVCIVAALLTAFGLWSACDMAYSILLGHFSLQLGFFALFFSTGLLLGWRRARKWVVALAWVGIAISVLGLAFVLAFGPDEETAVELTTVTTLLQIAVSMGSTLYVIWALTLPSSKSWFEEEKQDYTFARILQWSVAVVSMLFIVTGFVADWWMRDVLANAFTFQVEVIAEDSVSGTPISTHTAQVPFGGNRDALMDLLPIVHESIGSRSDGTIGISFSGIAVQPVALVWQAKGYEPMPFQITPDTEATLHLKLQPLVNAQNGPDSALTEKE